MFNEIERREFATYMLDKMHGTREHAAQARADADALEAVEREMRDPAWPYGATHSCLVEWADRIRGEVP